MADPYWPRQGQEKVREGAKATVIAAAVPFPTPTAAPAMDRPPTLSALSCCLLQPFQRVFPISRASAFFDFLVTDIATIGQDHFPNGSPVLVLAVRSKRDFFSKDQL